MSDLIKDEQYISWVSELKSGFKNAQIKATYQVNKELLKYYFGLGLQIIQKQKNTTWGSNFLGQLSKDLREEFPDISGFSKRNLELIRQWSLFYSDAFESITKQLASQLDSPNSEIAKQPVSQTEVFDFEVFIGNIFSSGDLDEKVVSSILEHTTKHGAIKGKTQEVKVKHYNLDVVLSVGYREKSILANFTL